jgi:1-acyl-sn-glycerol-3-phosphate acyltransferase
LEEAVGAIDGIRRGCVAIFGSADRATGTERLVILAESREQEGAAREALRGKIEELTIELLGGPPDDVVLAPPHTVLKTSSGKIRRAACRNLYERGEIGARRAVWWQLVRVWASALVPQLRRIARLAGAFMYATWCWAVLLILGPCVWLLIAPVPSRAWAWFIARGGCRFFLRLTAIPVQVEGGEWLAGAQPCVFVVNHQSYLDGVAVCAILPRPAAFVAKRVLDSQWVAGILLRRLGSEFVERFDKQRGLEDARRVTLEGSRGRSLVFFPEGTFFRMPGLQPFQMGAFAAAAEAGLPIVPVALRGTRMILRDTSWFPRPGRIAVTAGPPITAAGRDWNAAIRLRDQARGEILRYCGEPDLAPPSAG